ncbi:MAG TPA: S53 family peptidase [Streptosporangiaceae bacterium]|jgi:subtilase family serine protease
MTGAPASSARISFNVALPLRDQAQAMTLLRAVSSPHSARYGKFLTARQFNARFAPTAGQIAQVSSFLRGQGIQVTGVSQGNRWVGASGTVAQVQRAFGTTLKTYLFHGRHLRAATRSLSVPAALKPLVAGVSGVSQTIVTPASVTPASPVSDATGKPAASQPPPASCSVFWDQHEQTGPADAGRTSFPTPNCGYSPAQLRTAYGVAGSVKAGDTGRGVTVAIVDAYDSPTILADANAYATLQGEPQFKPGQFIDDSASTFDMQDVCNPPSWNIEQTLDVEAVHGMAPGATVAYVGASDCDAGIDTALNSIVQNHTASIVSDSFGEFGEQGLGDETTIEHSIFLQGALEGIGFYFSTGDSGDNVAAGDNEPEANYPATDTLVTAVGGTSLGLNSNNSYRFEVAWGNDIDPVNFATTPASYVLPPPGVFNSGAGGGTSRLFAQPFYQAGTVPAGLSEQFSAAPMRVVPDVGAVADPETGYLICIDAPDSGGSCSAAAGDTLTIGGTSLACPVFAGLQALASQGRFVPIGFADPLLYLLTSSAFHDVKSANAPSSPLLMITDSGRTLITMDSDSSLTDTKGYDDTTGRGTPNGLVFLLEETLLQGI